MIKYTATPTARPQALEHNRRLAAFYSGNRTPKLLSEGYSKFLAHRVNLIISPTSSVLEIGCGSGGLLHELKARRKVGVDLCVEAIEEGRVKYPELELHHACGENFSPNGERFDIIVLSDVLNVVFDVQELLENLHSLSHERTRLIINVQNTLWRPLLDAGRKIGVSRRQPEHNWLSRTDITNLCMLSGWDAFKSLGYGIAPLPMGPLSGFLNRWVSPLVPWACLTVFLVARKAPVARREPRSVSVIVPARNEAGSMASLPERVPRLGAQTELIIIEGNSTDDTWDQVLKLPSEFHGGRIVKLKQTGKGKGNAVREAFAKATGDIVTILDADLTMPPEDLPKYIELLASQKADFANGVRLVYPMDKEAMQFANLCANKGFSIVFSWLLGQPVKDTLCGTKAMWREDYEQLDANRAFFGDFDPFGDFDLLFGADKLNLKICDIPIRYKERFYGETNIQRWRHGVILLGMVIFAAKRLKFV
jgi:SAM-dependent methyltransferase